ncbi:MAG: carboxypeptidase-like regulatory domain-containing protein [Candidatus Binataceae bacterium]
MKARWTILLSAMLTLGLSAPAFSASVCGVARDAQGQPVSDVQVTVKNAAGQIVGQATTGANGSYNIDGLDAGTVDLFATPGSANFKNGSGVLALNSTGGTVNWNMSNSAPALAVQGGTCADPSAGLSPFAQVSVGVLGLGALTIAGVTTAYLATDQGDSEGQHHPHHPISPSF